MRIGEHDYETIAIIDDQNNLLCTIRDNQAICVEKLGIIAEEEPNKLAFVSMENSTTKCFVRQDGSVLPKGAMTATEFFKSNTVQEATEEEPKQEETPVETKTEEPKASSIPKINSDAIVIPGNVGSGGGIADVLKNMPPEALSAIMKAMMAQAPQEKKSETAEALAEFEEQLSKEQK